MSRLLESSRGPSFLPLFLLFPHSSTYIYSLAQLSCFPRETNFAVSSTFRQANAAVALAAIARLAPSSPLAARLASPACVERLLAHAYAAGGAVGGGAVGDGDGLGRAGASAAATHGLDVVVALIGPRGPMPPPPSPTKAYVPPPLLEAAEAAMADQVRDGERCSRARAYVQRIFAPSLSPTVSVLCRPSLILFSHCLLHPAPSGGCHCGCL